MSRPFNENSIPAERLTKYSDLLAVTARTGVPLLLTSRITDDIANLSGQSCDPFIIVPDSYFPPSDALSLDRPIDSSIVAFASIGGLVGLAIGSYLNAQSAEAQSRYVTATIDAIKKSWLQCQQSIVYVREHLPAVAPGDVAPSYFQYLYDMEKHVAELILYWYPAPAPVVETPVLPWYKKIPDWTLWLVIIIVIIVIIAVIMIFGFKDGKFTLLDSFKPYLQKMKAFIGSVAHG